MEAGLAVKSARESFGRARGVVLAAVTLALFAGMPAAAGADAPQPLLPDLVQEPPPLNSIVVQQDSASGHFQLGFTSIVGNVGAGPFEMRGIGPGGGQDMTAYQWIYQSSGPPQQGPEIGAVHYETELANHNHWHFQPFDDYQLRSLDGSQVWSDQKEGFCLINTFQVPDGSVLAGPAGSAGDYPIHDQSDPAYFCYRDHPEATAITEGISVGWEDEYTAFRGGQDVDLTGVPAGRYYLVQKVNSNGSIQELDQSNDAWSAAVDLSWPNGPAAMPAVKVLNSCPASETCPYTDPPPPPPPPPAAPDKTPPTLLLGGATRQRFLRGRAIYVYAKCSEPCTVTASGRIAALQIARSLRTASTRMALRPGVRTKIKLPISSRTRRIINRQLERHVRVIVRVTLSAADAAGNRTHQVRTLRLLPRSA
jgi:lysyl oxidase